MGIDYCLVLENEDSPNAFQTFKFFPLIIESLDKLSTDAGSTPLGNFMHHDPESDSTVSGTIAEGLKSVTQLIECVEASNKKKFDSFTKSEIVEELNELRAALQDNEGLSKTFCISLIY